jgi:PAS domain S-box-containing protein
LIAQTSLIIGLLWQRATRREAEGALKESEERFRLVANTAPVMIWTTGTDKLCDYVNKPWLDFTGRTFEQELGSGWAEGIHTEDVVNCLKTYTEAFDKREQFEIQYRVRRHDGEYRWIFDIGVPRFNQDGSFAGYIGSCIDVTERKLAEEALSTIGRRLIEAHEEERTWIGRELHDDINQRLALLAVELDLWGKEGSRSKFSDHLRHAQSRITEISKDVQALSHRLHSSKLEYLGLAVAARSFCKELSEKATVEVHFHHTAVPSNLPKEVSLCLFRVLQEALQNASKHSGVRVFHVNLCGIPDGLELRVSDDGIGFDEHEGFSRQGLGLISMRERLQMVHGVLDVRTHPGGGTTISARVPLQSAEMQAKAG